jgi:hypothetical protein
MNAAIAHRFLSLADRTAHVMSGMPVFDYFEAPGSDSVRFPIPVHEEYARGQGRIPKSRRASAEAVFHALGVAITSTGSGRIVYTIRTLRIVDARVT